MKNSGFLWRSLPIGILLIMLAACNEDGDIAYEGDNDIPEADADLDTSSDTEPPTENDTDGVMENDEEELEIICERGTYRCRTWSEVQFCAGDRWRFVKECAESEMVCFEGDCVEYFPDGDESEDTEWDEEAEEECEPDRDEGEENAEAE